MFCSTNNQVWYLLPCTLVKKVCMLTSVSMVHNILSKFQPRPEKVVYHLGSSNEPSIKIIIWMYTQTLKKSWYFSKDKDDVKRGRGQGRGRRGRTEAGWGEPYSKVQCMMGNCHMGHVDTHTHTHMSENITFPQLC